MPDIYAMPAPSTMSAVVFLLTIGTVVVFWIRAAQVAWFEKRKLAALYASTFWAIWLGLTAALPASGLLIQPAPVPLVFPFMLSLMVIALTLCFSPVGQRLTTLPMSALIAIQAFRLPLEWVLHQWLEQGIVPVQMTWSGQNFDIIIGALALPVAFFVHGRDLSQGVAKWVAVAFHLLGLFMLLNIMRIFMTSTPGPLFSFPEARPLVLGVHAPWGWIGSVAVVSAVALHVIALRKLRILSQASKAGQLAP